MLSIFLVIKLFTVGNLATSECSYGVLPQAERTRLRRMRSPGRARPRPGEFSQLDKLGRKMERERVTSHLHPPSTPLPRRVGTTTAPLDRRVAAAAAVSRER